MNGKFTPTPIPLINNKNTSVHSINIYYLLCANTVLGAEDTTNESVKNLHAPGAYVITSQLYRKLPSTFIYMSTFDLHNNLMR